MPAKPHGHWLSEASTSSLAAHLSNRMDPELRIPVMFTEHLDS